MQNDKFEINKNESGKCNKNFFFTISIVGPRQSGKTTLLKSIVNHYTKIKNWDPSMTISILNPKGDMNFFFENISDILSIINCIKVSDLIISIIDGFFGLEMETFETLSIIKKSKFKRYVFILTHLDLFKTWKALKKAKKRIKDRILKEIDRKCKIFYFSGMRNENVYFTGEIKNLTRYLSKIKSQNKPTSGFQDIALISKIEFQKTLNRLIICFTGYIKKDQLFSKQHRNCFVPGLGRATILSVKKLTEKINLQEKSFRLEINSSTSKNLYSRDGRYSITKELYRVNKNKFVSRLCSFFSNVIFFKKLRDKKLLLTGLIDSTKIFNISSSSCEIIKIENLLNKLRNNNLVKKRKKFELTSQIILPMSSFSNFPIRTTDKHAISIEKCYVRLVGFSPAFKRYYDAYSFLFILFDKQKQKKLIIAKINKNKWEKTNLYSGRHYIISIGWKLILTKLYFCNQKNNDNFYILKNLKNNGFSFISFFTEFDQSKDLVIGIKNKRQIRNKFNQGTTFSCLFIGEVVFLSNIFKMYKRIKIKGVIFKKFKKTAFIKGMFPSDVEAIKFKNGIIKTSQGVIGIIKNVKQGNSCGVIRATFEKKIQNDTLVTCTTFVNIQADRISNEMFFHLIPDDHRDLLY